MVKQYMKSNTNNRSKNRARPRNYNYKRLKKGYLSNGMWGLAKKAATGVVKYYLNPEYKFLEWTNTTFQPSTTPQVFGDPSWLAAGTSDTTRTGNQIKVTSIQAKILITRNTSATLTQVRCVFFYAVAPNGSLPSFTQVFESNDVNSYINKDYGIDYKILFDKVYLLDVYHPQKEIQIYEKMQHHIKYLDSNAGDSSMGNGAIYFACISNEATNTPIVKIRTRMRYLDN